MSAYKTFAVWGAGNVGLKIVRELLKEPSVAVTVLCRPESKDNERNKKLIARGVTVIPFDVSAEDASSALKGIDVLIATPASEGVSLQPQLIRAAHTAGVKLFIPAEWGGEDPTAPTHAFKEKLRADAAALGLPTSSFFGGIQTDRLPMFGFDLAHGKITIRGEGEASVSLTSMDDIARFTAHALVHLPHEKLQNAKFFFEGDRISFYGLAQQLEKFSSKPLDVKRTGRKEIEDAIKTNPRDMFAHFFLAFEDGKGAHSSQLANGLWPEFNPKTAAQVLSPMLG